MLEEKDVNDLIMLQLTQDFMKYQEQDNRVRRGEQEGTEMRL